MNFARSASTRRTGVAIASAVAVAMSGLAFTGTAHAATTVTVTNSQIRPDESTYPGWHQGNPGSTSASAATSKGLESIGKSQILYGYDNNDNAGLANDGVNADLSEDLIGASYNVTEGEAHFQVPLFVDTDGAGPGPGVFTTLRPLAPATGQTTISGTDLWTASKPVGSIAAHTGAPLNSIISAIESGTYKTIGFGVFTDTAKTSTVSSISFDGTTYEFAADAPTQATVRNSQLRGEETSSNYTTWHQGYDDAAHRAQITSQGLELVGKSQVIKGLANNGKNVNRVNVFLPFALSDVSYTVTEGRAYFQIPVFFQDGEEIKFTTLRNTGKGIGTHGVSLDEQWKASSKVGAINAGTETTLRDLIAELGTYKVIGYGVLTDVGETATVSQITFDGVETTFADEGVAATEAELVVAPAIAPNEDVYAGWHQGSTGSASINGDALDISTGKSQVIRGYDNNAKNLNDRNVNLAEALRTASYSVKSGTVHFQVPIFFEDPITAEVKFTTLRPAAPAAAGVNTFSIADEWISTGAITGLVPAHGSAPLGEILSAVREYKVLGFGVFSDTGETGLVDGITWDGVEYSFGKAATSVAATTASSATTASAVTVKTQISVAANAPGASAAGGTITVTDGSKRLAQVSAGAGAINIAAGKLAAGTRTLKISFAGTSSTNASSTTVRVVVAKVRTTLTAKAPKTVKVGKKFKLAVTAKATGASVEGASVTVKRGSKTVGTGRIKGGKASVTISKLAKGKHKLTVTVAATSMAGAVKKSVIVTAKK